MKRPCRTDKKYNNGTFWDREKYLEEINKYIDYLETQKKESFEMLENVSWWDTCPEDYKVIILYNRKVGQDLRSMEIDVPIWHKGNDWSYCSAYFNQHHGEYYHLSIQDN